MPLQLNRVVTLPTCFIRNTLAIRPLAAGVAAIERIRPFGIEHVSTHFTDLCARRLRQTTLPQLLAIADIAAFLVIAVFLRPDSRIENASTALADYFTNRRHRFILAADLPVIVVFQNILMLIFPIASPHGFNTPHNSMIVRAANWSC